ncbi:hypothetical protein PRIPAC_85221 [Pristionchus pacificus]|uniref:Uncharacterized protein n=1 Tax=Pristionchus pacificus TaxID=54126 RepID=A0A2A6BTQ5_PRIPA|nr:hypothetical protein PRIPAC_85221 [Pristionchus pacificus]|eukprot:PDM69362.1 hypothetical protein PRIPAC_47664 [Pristionchus pacificus]
MRVAIVSALLVIACQSNSSDESDNTSNIADSTVAGMACLKTAHGSYFRGWDRGQHTMFDRWKLEVTDHCDSQLRWYIEYYGMNVALKPEWMPFEFLIANDDGSVNLKTWPGLDERLWTPAKNEDGSCVDENGTISTTNDTTDVSKNFLLDSRGEWSFYSHQASYPRKESHSRHRKKHHSYVDETGVNLSSTCGPCDQWIVELDVRLIKPTCEGKAYLSAQRGGSVKIRYTFGFGNEHWRAFKNEGNGHRTHYSLLMVIAIVPVIVIGGWAGYLLVPSILMQRRHYALVRAVAEGRVVVDGHMHHAIPN